MRIKNCINKRHADLRLLATVNQAIHKAGITEDLRAIILRVWREEILTVERGAFRHAIPPVEGMVARRFVRRSALPNSRSPHVRRSNANPMPVRNL